MICASPCAEPENLSRQAARAHQANGAQATLNPEKGLIYRDKPTAVSRHCRPILHKKNIICGTGNATATTKMAEGLGGPPPRAHVYWKSFRTACVDWFAIESDCTPSCCCTCKACSLVEATFKSASTSEPMPSLSEVCKEDMKVD